MILCVKAITWDGYVVICKVNRHVVLDSSDCYKCSNTLYIALTLIFGILGGIVYVLVLFGLRLTIDLGTFGGCFWLVY